MQLPVAQWAVDTRLGMALTQQMCQLHSLRWAYMVAAVADRKEYLAGVRAQRDSSMAML